MRFRETIDFPTDLGADPSDFEVSPIEATTPPLTIETANPVTRAQAIVKKGAALIGAPAPNRNVTLVTGAAVGYLLRGPVGAAIGFALAAWASQAPKVPVQEKTPSPP